MPENSNPIDDRHYDDELARFADRMIGGEQPEVPEMDSNNQEMVELMQTVASLERVFKAERPDPAMAKRIRANLLKEWEVSGPAVERSSFWERLWSAPWVWPQAQRRMVTSIGAVALVFVAAALVMSTSLTGGSVTGSGGGLGQVPEVLIVGGLIVLAGVLWLLSRSSH